MDDPARTKQSLLERAMAGDGIAVADLQRRLQDGLARSGDDGHAAGDRTQLLRGAYAAALDLLPRLADNLADNQERR